MIDITGQTPLVTGLIGGTLGAVSGGIISYANNQPIWAGALVGGTAGFALGSGTALFALAAQGAGYSALQTTIATGTLSATVLKSLDLIQQQLSGKPINLRQTAGATAIGFCGPAVTGALGGGVPVDLGIGLSIMPIEILNGLGQ